MKGQKKHPASRLLGWGLVAVIVFVLGLAGFRIVRWKAYLWMPQYAVELVRSHEAVPDSAKHVLFVMVDHYEPGYGEDGVRRNRLWLERFRRIADRHHDSYGNRFRYTWFYPYDHKNMPVLRDLTRMPFEGYGEIELHWHHPQATNATFPGMLAGAVAWFEKFGAFRVYGPRGETRFAFIHGNWALDDSREWKTGSGRQRCGVPLEITFLQRQGCYADLTFPAFGTTAQPAKINSIYYAEDTPERKSYNHGKDAEVGDGGGSGLLLLEGPLGVDVRSLGFEYGAVEDYALPTPRRIEAWIDTDVHVKGRPEWIFVKVYSHGQQSRHAILEKRLDPMLGDLEGICSGKGYHLHYMTAREAYNVIRAAEAGESGDPERYRDFEIGPRCCAFFHTPVPVTIQAMSPDGIAFRPDSLAEARYEFHDGVLKEVEGRLRELRYDAAARTLRLDAEGRARVVATAPVRVIGAPAELIVKE